MEEGGEGRNIVGAGSLHVIDDGGLVAMGDEAMRGIVWRKKNGDGDRGVICSRARVSGGVGERRKKERREGRGACVEFVVYRSLSDVRENVF